MFGAVLSYSLLTWIAFGFIHFIIRSYVLSTFDDLLGHSVKFKYILKAYKKANALPIYDHNDIDRFIETMVDELKTIYRELKN